ncbi:aldehyde dehydrogenase (plasmid) [Rhizobium ruizarguesonis]|uniref:aldehyde dehydrogenase n=1 Tax=Rhizobium ruizarguesonis TaxID=2081791 RepID=UPI00102F49A1|nr:aldehyde dehydrogenase [Rhizobium ruizarguesonis]MBY5882414.1 aldehyde dehydrogenase [Rhizobium leguminosarum]NKL12722.1 aldehyde dehydrogenase family protein [Rhizobium leguminosarum bv. viciae]NKL41750.1 aldehyde dehydrogenase family protein [Rhizobium leguminosarum bv. viciae]TBB15058.1 aldehyde dehydrogenase [Rhizobium ruizarguesonis]
MQEYKLYIGGQNVDPSSGEWLETIDPYKGTPWARIARGNKDDASRAVAAAKLAMTGPWAEMSATQRGKILRNIGDAVVENADRLAEIEVRDNGKLLTEMRGQLAMISEYWYYYAGLADKIEGTVVPIEKADSLALTLREPVGVVAALTAWNSPLMFCAMKCAPALAAGCAVVLKPSEFASVSTLEFAALTKKAGLPDGVLNVVTGLGTEAGAALIEHPDVSKISFTGSDVTGARIYEIAARSMKRVTMELGGKSPNIVFDDADLDAAAIGVISGIFGAAGQMCTAGSRLLVQNTIKDAFTKKLISLAQEIRLGDPMAPETNVGPIATPPQYQKVLDYLATANSDGARCILGGGPATGPGLIGGQFIQPTIFTDVTNDMRIAQEEVFGPILSILGFDTEQQAIEIGNDVIYGLAAGVWTANIGRAVRVSKAIKAGTVWVNTYRAYSYMLPSGGMKRSGLGRESGMEAINQFLETKGIILSTAASAPVNPFIQR